MAILPTIKEMSEEVAERVLDEYIYDGKTLREWIESLVKLEKALEPEPCEDAISREEMLKYQWYLHGKMPNEENHKLWQFIKSLPSVTPKQKTGEILTDYAIVIDINGFERRVKKTTYCSLCKCDLGYNGDLLTHYCPNCGVKLEYKGR